MRASLISFTFLLAATVLLVSGCGGCSTGYQQVDGKWAYVTINTGAGRSVNYIEGADQETFEVLAEDIYAKVMAFSWVQVRPERYQRQGTGPAEARGGR